MTPEGSSSERRADNPVGDITLQDAISLVVRQRPELAAFGWERSARDAQLRQAGAYPNPVVEGVAEMWLPALPCARSAASAASCNLRRP